MPLYEYECDVCGHHFEAIRKFSDPPLDVCPKCGGHIHKLISSPAFQFKGTGWYITDYAKKDSGKPGGSQNKESGEKESTTSDKDSTESKTGKEHQDSKAGHGSK